MPISATGIDCLNTGGRGFSLVELLVALSIAALALATAPFAVARAYEAMQFRDTVRHVIAGLKLARLEAIRSGRSAAFDIDFEERRFGVGEQFVRGIPDGLEMRLIAADVEIAGARGGIRFYPDGGATGGSIDILRPSGDGVRIDVDWLLGRLGQRKIVP